MCAVRRPDWESLGAAGRLPRALILMDMIGDRDLNIRRDTYSTPWLTDILWASAARLGYGRHFLNEPMPVEDDHAPFLKAGVPAALLIDFDYPPWHTADDTLEQISPKSLGIVGEVILDTLPALETVLFLSGLVRVWLLHGARSNVRRNARATIHAHVRSRRASEDATEAGA